jgi:hypothetical protein
MSNKDLENPLLKSIEDVKEIVESDIQRLRTIVDAINTGDVHLDINDKLIFNLNKISFQDRDIEIAVEYLTLILSNIESQKINYNKQVSEELIGVLRHTLSAVKNLENWAMLVNDMNTCNIVDGKKKDPYNEAIQSANTAAGGVVSVLKLLLPNNKISNSMFWIIILFTVFGIAYVINPDIITKFSSTAEKNIGTIKQIQGIKDKK